ncbi:unnamed protein product [Gordionus sp. m RMFG-2023]
MELSTSKECIIDFKKRFSELSNINEINSANKTYIKSLTNSKIACGKEVILPSIFSITSNNGRRIYLDIKNNINNIQTQLPVDQPQKLLLKTYKELYIESQNIIEKNELSNSLNVKATSSLKNYKEISPNSEHINQDHKLWTDKYRARKYIELLTEEAHAQPLMNQTLG